MAATVTARAITEAHRVGQLRLRAVTIRDVLAVWPLYDINDPDHTWANFERVLLALIGGRSAQSAQLAAAYYRAFRQAEGIVGTAAPVVASTLPPDELIRSLRYVGLVNTRTLIEAKAADAGARTLTNVTGDVTRHVLNAGRDTIVESVTADPRALGWTRVTDSKPCSFCRMLAGRGPVYRGKGSGFKAHGHCGCTAEPTYHADAPWPGRAREFRDQWDETTKGLSGADARKAFRQAVEGRTPAPV